MRDAIATLQYCLVDICRHYTFARCMTHAVDVICRYRLLTLAVMTRHLISTGEYEKKMAEFMRKISDFNEKTDDSVNLFQASKAFANSMNGDTQWPVFKKIIETRVDFNDPRFKYKPVVYNLHALSVALKGCRGDSRDLLEKLLFCGLQFMVGVLSFYIHYIQPRAITTLV